MSSVTFQGRGRRGRTPYSHYAPLIVSDDKPLFKVLANDAVPQGLSGVTKDQQIGYWNEQPRWRMRRGERVDLNSKWHFYYLGTGPHEDVPFRKRTEGVFWVAIGGAKAEPTGLGTRKPNVKPLEPNFKSGLPNNVEIVEPTTPQNSRQNSRSRSRGPQSRNQSNSRDESQSRNNKRDQSNNRNQSKGRSQSRNQSNDRDNGSSRDDLIDAVKEALKSLGIGQNHPQKRQNDNQSGSRTPKNKSRSNSKQRDPDNKPEWRKTPTDNIEACFGPRGGFRNFGDSEMMQKGVNASGYAQIASLTPSSAAILFGGNVQTRQLADEVEITYTYKMNVPKDNPALALFIEQVDAYKNGTPKEQRVKKQKRSKSPAPPPLPNQTDGDEGEQESHYENVSDVLPPGAQVEIINEVYDDASSVRQQS
uniref:Nucleoprotein n=1 Tax=Bat Coronavirus MrJX20 TaxID=3018859 RepID=A0AA49ECE7_9NIDO|nr:nucleocapsid phosphoprotein [Bat Coronavirus MrJX20]